jgi:hypothetical protein
VHVRELPIDPTKLYVMTDAELVVAKVAAPRLVAAEEAEEVAAEAAAEAVAAAEEEAKEEKEEEAAEKGQD